MAKTRLHHAYDFLDRRIATDPYWRALFRAAKIPPFLAEVLVDFVEYMKTIPPEEIDDPS